MFDGLTCPSAQPNEADSTVIGVVVTRDGRERVSLLPRPVPLSSVAHLIPDTVPVTEVLRLAAPRAERYWRYFSGPHSGGH